MIASNSASSSLSLVSMIALSSGNLERSSRQTETPSPSGSRMSSTATSGAQRRHAGQRLAGVLGLPDDGDVPSLCSRSATPRRTILWSSRRNTVIGAAGPSKLMRCRPPCLGVAAGTRHRKRDARGRPRRGWGSDRLGVLVVGRVVSPLQRALYRASGARLSLTGRAPVLLLTTTGRRTGLPRTVPLFYVHDERGSSSATSTRASSGPIRGCSTSAPTRERASRSAATSSK